MPRTRRHNACDAARFLRSVGRVYSRRHIARLLGVSDRTVRRWEAGVDWPTVASLLKLIDLLFPPLGALPLYDPAMALDGNTRVGGVGEYTIRAARCDADYLLSLASEANHVHPPPESPDCPL
jgi:transcriptional regulator with XRE-family HTH domain